MSPGGTSSSAESGVNTASRWRHCQPTLLQQQLLAFAAFSTGNVGLSEFNAWALAPTHWPNFAFPVFYTMHHMLFVMVVSYIALRTCTPPDDAVGTPCFEQFWAYRWPLITLSICTSLNNGFNNLSLTLVSLFVNQVVKACQPLPTYAFSYLLAGKRYGPIVTGSVVAVVGGSILACKYKLSQSSDRASDESTMERRAEGIIACLIGLLAASLKPVVAMMVMSGTLERPKLPPMTVLFYDMCLSFLVMLLVWLCSSEREAALDYLGNGNTTAVGVMIIIVGSTFAFVFQASNYYFVLLTSALTSSIGSNGIRIFLLCITAIQSHVTDGLSWLGICLVILSIGAYTYGNYVESDSSPQEGGKQAMLDAEKGPAPSEHTPLKG